MDQFREELRMKQFKSKQNNPSSNGINLLNMIESRIMEIVQIEEECKRKLPKLYHQRLPRFMRRRAGCHNTKRLPKSVRHSASADFGTKDRKTLMKYRRRVRFRKHKRILKSHSRHKYNDPFKSLTHKWFAKRFKMGVEGDLNHVPIYNNTKNQRNLYRQSRYGCAYLSLAHLQALQISLSSSAQGAEDTNQNKNLVDQFNELNLLTNQAAGFTFGAKSLQKGRYEVGVHLYEPRTEPPQYLCHAHVSFSETRLYQTNADTVGTQQPSQLTLWVPRSEHEKVCDYLEAVSKESEKKFTVSKIHPCDSIRIRLFGPNAREEASKVASNLDEHKKAIEDVERRLSSSWGVSIGRHLEEKAASFTYYKTEPLIVDIAFRTSEGRMLWHKLIKNKAHLVGGHRDLDRLLVRDRFNPKPDHDLRPD